MVQAPNTYDAEPIPDRVRSEIDELLGSGDLFRYTHPERAAVPRLESAFAAMLGSTFALAVSSCSGAIFLALRALDLAPGARVLIPGFTFAAVPSAVVHANCVPVLVEVGDNYRIDLDDFDAKFDDSIDAVLISHMRGHTSDMDAIMAAAEARGVPVVEDAAHSLGTTWGGQNIGTIGKVGAFSFQSYKLINSGEGGMLVTDDPVTFARAVIMSGAYENNWKHHPKVANLCAEWQNHLPLYNMRMQNLSAAVILAQLDEVPRRIADGRAGHDRVAARLNGSPWLHVPPPLRKEVRAPDSIQFSLNNFSGDEARRMSDLCAARGVPIQIFGLSQNNARAFWNWKFLGDVPELPKTRDMLMKTCDCRLPARLTNDELDFIADATLTAAEHVKGPNRAVA